MTDAELAQIKLRHHVATDGWTCATCLTGVNGWTGDEVFAPYPCDAARLIGRVEESERELAAERAVHRVEMEGMRESNATLLDETRRLQGRVEEPERVLEALG